MLSRFFIDRPVFAAVISIFLVLAGLAAMRVLPIAQYPEIAPPVVTVQAIYPGASHGFINYSYSLAKQANERIETFLRDRVAAATAVV